MMINNIYIDPMYLSFENGEAYYTTFPPYITDAYGFVIWTSWYGYTAVPIKVKLSEYVSRMAA